MSRVEKISGKSKSHGPTIGRSAQQGHASNRSFCSWPAGIRRRCSLFPWHSHFMGIRYILRKGCASSISM